MCAAPNDVTSNNVTSFSNQSGVVVTPISGSNDSDTNPKEGYEQTLTQLSFSDGSTSIDNGQSGTLEWPETEPIINLLISKPSNLFPVLATSAGPDYSVSGWPKPNKPISVSSDDVAATSSALKFRQNLMAAPSSTLAEDFQKALKEAQSLSTAEDIISAMDDFFSNTPPYQDVTYSGYDAVQSYLNAFAYLWVQKNTASKSSDTGARYYIYSAPSAGKTGASSKGTIVATRNSDAPTNASLTDPLCGFTVTLKDSDGKNPTNLDYSRGTFVDGTAVNLVATYAYSGRFTGNISDVQLWPVLVGTLLGIEVLAIPVKPEDKSGWDKFVSGLTWESGFRYFMDAMGLWMAYDLIKSKLGCKKRRLEEDRAENAGEDPSEDQVRAADEDSGYAASEEHSDLEESAQSISGDSEFVIPETESEISDRIWGTRSTSSESLNSLAEDNINGALSETGSTLESLAEIEMTPAIEQAANDLNEAGKALKTSPPDISSATESVKSANANLSTSVEELQDKLSEQEKEQYKEEIKANQAAAEEARAQSEESDKVSEGDDPDGIPEEPIELELL